MVRRSGLTSRLQLDVVRFGWRRILRSTRSTSIRRLPRPMGQIRPRQNRGVRMGMGMAGPRGGLLSLGPQPSFWPVCWHTSGLATILGDRAIRLQQKVTATNGESPIRFRPPPGYDPLGSALQGFHGTPNVLQAPWSSFPALSHIRPVGFRLLVGVQITTLLEEVALSRRLQKALC